MTSVPRETEPVLPEAELLHHGVYHANGVLMLDPSDEKSLEAARRLVERGLLRDCGTVSWCAGEHCYRVTDRGQQVAAELKALREPKLTRSQQRYRDWLESASEVMSFGAFLTRRRSP